MKDFHTHILKRVSHDGHGSIRRCPCGYETKVYRCSDCKDDALGERLGKKTIGQDVFCKGCGKKTGTLYKEQDLGLRSKV